MYKELRAELEKTNGDEEIIIDLYRRDLLMSSSFASKEKGGELGRMTVLDNLALLTDLRREVSSAGWHIVSCELQRGRGGQEIHLKVRPAQDKVEVLAPRDIWPHIKTYADLNELAVDGLTQAVAETIIVEAMKTDCPSLNLYVDLPASCRAVSMERLHVVISTVRDRISEKWKVDKFDLVGGGL